MQWKLILMAVLMCVMTVSHAQVYKWVDDNGKVHYSDIPHDGVQQGIPVKSDTPEKKKEQQKIEQQRREKTKKLLHAFGEERRIKREKETKAKQEQIEKERECNRVRNELSDLQRGGASYYELDEDGKRRFLLDADIKKRIIELRKEVGEWC